MIELVDYIVFSCSTPTDNEKIVFSVQLRFPVIVLERMWWNKWEMKKVSSVTNHGFVF